MGYNGWSNYETWLVHLWISNEYADYHHWRERTKDTLDAVGGDPEQARYNLARKMEIEITEAAMADVPSCGMVADLIGAALCEVDWVKIASHLIDEAVFEAQSSNT